MVRATLSGACERKRKATTAPKSLHISVLKYTGSERRVPYRHHLRRLPLVAATITADSQPPCDMAPSDSAHFYANSARSSDVFIRRYSSLLPPTPTRHCPSNCTNTKLTLSTRNVQTSMCFLFNCARARFLFVLPLCRSKLLLSFCVAFGEFQLAPKFHTKFSRTQQKGYYGTLLRLQCTDFYKWKF